MKPQFGEDVVNVHAGGAFGDHQRFVDTYFKTYRGKYFTGDGCRRDEDGYFWYVARGDDMIVSAGYNIGAPEVEHAILTHPKVAEAAVVGWPDEDRGQICKAFVVLHDPADATGVIARDIQSHVKRVIAPYKYPRAVEFVAELPKTASGKLQRFKLREGL